jgi:hypothetical protein
MTSPDNTIPSRARRLQASAFLRDWKGYEIILYYENQTPGRTEISQVPGQPEPSLQPLFVEEKEELHAHIFEAATGNLVWS